MWGVYPGGKLIVKGEEILEFIMNSRVTEEVVWAAIPCEAIEQAVAFKAHLKAGGDSDKTDALIAKWDRERK